MGAPEDNGRERSTPPSGKAAHPGATLQRRFMDPNRLGVNQLARALGVPPNRISAILSGQRSITADTALRLARFFDTTALYWMNLQARHDLTVAEQVVGQEIASSVPTLEDHRAREAQRKADSGGAEDDADADPQGPPSPRARAS